MATPTSGAPSGYVHSGRVRTLRTVTYTLSGSVHEKRSFSPTCFAFPQVNGLRSSVRNRPECTYPKKVYVPAGSVRTRRARALRSGGVRREGPKAARLGAEGVRREGPQPAHPSPRPRVRREEPRCTLAASQDAALVFRHENQCVRCGPFTAARRPLAKK